ncbi:MAG TPA: hypothetical protein VJ617_10055 [Arthrobacter sp.]|nr:hypothetical protein [Arthrobacter sp.]
MVNAYPRESVEFQPVNVTQDGIAVTSGLSFAVVADGTRPTTFTAATVLDGKSGVLLTGLTPGTYRVFAKLTNSPEIPVIDCGYFYIT